MILENANAYEDEVDKILNFRLKIHVEKIKIRVLFFHFVMKGMIVVVLEEHVKKEKMK
jgi:hypothetical protein